MLIRNTIFKTKMEREKDIRNKSQQFFFPSASACWNNHSIPQSLIQNLLKGGYYILVTNKVTLQAT